MILQKIYFYLLYCTLLGGINLSAQNINYIPFKTANQVSPQTIDLSSSHYVGTIVGKARSNGSGTANYTVPIELPSGTGDLQPILNLKYSSGSTRNDILGQGWSLSGLSVINRTSKTNFHDGKLEPIRFNDMDRFALNGLRLYPMAQNGNDGTVYKSEQENQSRIISHGSNNNSPSYFSVETKNGITHVYGGESNAKIYDNQGTPIAWYISASYDKFGNHIRYFYEEVNNEHRIHSIYYNGTETDPRTKVKFLYKERADKNFKFINNKHISSHSLLDKIEVYYGEGIYNNPNWTDLKSHTYEFKYSKDNIDSYLSELHKVSGNGLLTYNPTIFYYGKFDPVPLTNESTYAFTNQTVGSHGDYLIGDFNGDGLSDFARLEVKDGAWNTPLGVSDFGSITYKGFTVSINNGDGNSFTELSRVGFKDNGNQPYHVQHLSVDNRIVFRTGDFDGDGKQEILVTEFESDYSPNKIYSYSIFDIEGNSITESAHSFAIAGEDYAKLNENFTLPGNLETRHQYVFNNAFVTGDFDGDQSTDIIFNYHYESDTQNRSWYHNPRKNYIKELKTNSPSEFLDFLLFKQYSRPPSLISYDVDKDGDSELLAVYDSVVAPITTNNVELNMVGDLVNNIIQISHYQSFIIAHDINENLRLDHVPITKGTILFNSGSPGDYAGNQTTIAQDYIDNHMFNAEPYSGLANLRCSDFNGDGIMDLKFESRGVSVFKHYIVYGKTTNIDFNLNYKADIWSDEITELDFGITNDNKPKHRILPFDYNTDGLTDFLEFDLSGDGGMIGPSRMTLHYNKGNGEFVQEQQINTSWNRKYANPNPGSDIHWNIYPGYFNRDSKLDLFFDLPINYSPTYDYSDNEHLLFFKKTQRLEDDLHRLVTVRNGLGEVSHFSYRMMSDPYIYTRGTGSEYPFSDYQSNTPLLFIMKKDNGLGTYINSQYRYESATIHRQGQGYLGYDKVTTFSPNLNSKQISTSKLLAEPIVKVPNITEVFNTAGTSDVLISRSETNYYTPTYNQSLFAFSYQEHKCFRYNVQSTVSANYLDGGINKNEYTYDDYDNIESMIKKVYNKASFTGSFVFNSSDLVQTSTKTNIYGQYNTWIPSSLLQSTSIMNYHDGVSSLNTSVTTRYSYYSSGRPRYIYNYHGSPKIYYDYFTYYPNGLVKTSKTSGGGIVKNFTTYEYDSFQNLKKVINAEGDETVSIYYDKGASGGQIQTMVSASGLMEQYIYNGFGHPYTHTDARGNTSYTTYDWITDPALQSNLNALYQIKVDEDGIPNQTTISDRLKRFVRSKTESLNDNEIIVDAEYNEIGLKRRESEPYHIGQSLPVHFTAFYYDDFNRGIQNVRFSTSTGSDPYSYLKATTTLALPIPAPNATYRSTSVTAPDGRIKTTHTDFTGKTLEIIENGTSVKHKYYTSGRLESTKIFTPNQSTGGNYDQTMVEYTYDIQGNLIKKEDNSIGEEFYTYNDYGELISETNSSGENSHYTYDLLGRPLTKIKPEGNTTYEYWTSSNITPVGSFKPGLGMIKSSTLSVGGTEKHKMSYEYNTFNDVSEIKEEFDTETPVIKTFTYNTFGQVNKKTYHTGFSLNYEYQPNNGELYRILSPSVIQGINAELLKIEQKDAYGHIVKYKRGGNNALTTYNTYNERGFLLNSKIGTVQEINYNFNHQSGNLREKEDVMASKYERYTYDEFDRLEKTLVGSAYTQYYSDGSNMNFASQEPQIDINFHESENLNINSKSQVAQSITYDPIAVNQIDAVITASGVPSALQLGSILNNTNTSFHKPERLLMDIDGSNYEVNFEFGANEKRKRALVAHGDVLAEKRLYYDNYEEFYTYNPSTGNVEDVYNMHFVGIGNGLEFAYTTKNGLTNGWNNMFFTLTDYQGSILKVTDRLGNTVDNLEYNYDAWGRRRDKTTWTYDGASTEVQPTGGVDANGNHWSVEDYDNPGETIAPPITPVTSTIGTDWFKRGYTGHEHYDEFQMIHMNARLYNPFLGTFLSPDRLIADPSNSQNYNRYSYALGNPTKYTDPSGYAPIGGLSARASVLFSAVFFAGDITGMIYGDFNEGINSSNLDNQFNNIGIEGIIKDEVDDIYFDEYGNFLHDDKKGNHVQIVSNDCLEGFKKAVESKKSPEELKNYGLLPSQMDKGLSAESNARMLTYIYSMDYDISELLNNSISVVNYEVEEYYDAATETDVEEWVFGDTYNQPHMGPAGGWHAKGWQKEGKYWISFPTSRGKHSNFDNYQIVRNLNAHERFHAENLSRDEAKAYENMMKHDSWQKTPEYWRDEMIGNYKIFK